MTAGSLVTIACFTDLCGHSAEFELTEEQSRKDPNCLRFSCKRCNGKGRIIAYIPMQERQDPLRAKCTNCQELLSEERKRAMLGTCLCVDCASSSPDDDKRKFTKDSFGSREAFKRDRGSWRR
jgi:hypothetical protein